MSFIKGIRRLVLPELDNNVIQVEYSAANELMDRFVMMDLTHQIVEALAKKFVEEHGDEILKRINDQVIDGKVISKVISNLRKELKEESE